ncbi:Histone promoter control protein, partial [Lachnellula suecica]
IVLGPDPNTNVRAEAPPAPAQNGKNEDIQRPMTSFFTSGPPPPPAQPYQHQQALPPQSMRSSSSGQNYDPIRSNYDPVRETVVNHPPPQYNSQGSPGQPNFMNRASASPSISSLVDPPNQALTSPSIAAQSFFNQQQARLQHEGHGSVPPSPTVNRLAPAPTLDSSPKPPTPASVPRRSETGIPQLTSSSMTKKNSMGPGSTATSSAAASPKPHKLKDNKDIYPAPPPLPGSGLMQLGGMGGPEGDGTEFRAPTVILNIPMNGEVNKIINFTRMAEDRYGWDALHPRLAAQRDRLARVAAAGAALERNGSGRDSGDDMSLDSDAEGSNIEMGGMSDGRTGTDGGVKKIPRKRKMKEDEYDKDDAFVDDSELLWEEQAAAATDGFFVYSGPLVPEGEKPPVEMRADGIPKRGRGSRGGRGGTRGGPGSRGGAAIAVGINPNINPRTGLPLSGPGSRGGSTTRKPRITKADRERMQQEKLEREKMGSMASMPVGYGGMAQLASAANMGNTPMVFNS